MEAFDDDEGINASIVYTVVATNLFNIDQISGNIKVAQKLKLVKGTCYLCVVKVWSVYGQCVVSVWSVCGQCVVSVWSVCRQCVVSVSSVCGLCVDCVWSVCGQCVVCV